MRRPQEEAARSTNESAKSALDNGISLRDVRGITFYDDPKGFAQRLEPPPEVSLAITIYFHDAETFRISDILDSRLKRLRGFVFAFDWNSPPHLRLVVRKHHESVETSLRFALMLHPQVNMDDHVWARGAVRLGMTYFLTV